MIRMAISISWQGSLIAKTSSFAPRARSGCACSWLEAKPEQIQRSKTTNLSPRITNRNSIRRRPASAASYCNFRLGPDRMLVPGFRAPEDEIAGLLKDLSNTEVTLVDCRDLAGLGSIALQVAINHPLPPMNKSKTTCSLDVNFSSRFMRWTPIRVKSDPGQAALYRRVTLSRTQDTSQPFCLPVHTTFQIEWCLVDSSVPFSKPVRDYRESCAIDHPPLHCAPQWQLN